MLKKRGGQSIINLKLITKKQDCLLTKYFT